jgi:hypothetical protein
MNRSDGLQYSCASCRAPLLERRTRAVVTVNYIRVIDGIEALVCRACARKFDGIMEPVRGEQPGEEA